MAIVWQSTENNTRYEVRSAGKSLRLYTNNVFHSQYNPGYLFTGGIWDALSLPSLFTMHPVKKILVLGVGGGTAIHQLQKLVNPVEITGVEINPVHLEIAKKYFGLEYKNLTLIEGDAVDYVRQQRNNEYDFIVDDIFLEGRNNPYRPVSHSGEWISLLNEKLTETGTLVQNYLSNRDAADAIKAHRIFLDNSFNTALRVNVSHYENGIVAFLKSNVTAKDARLRAQHYLGEFFKHKDIKKLRYQLRKL